MAKSCQIPDPSARWPPGRFFDGRERKKERKKGRREERKEGRKKERKEVSGAPPEGRQSSTVWDGDTSSLASARCSAVIILSAGRR